MSKKKLLAADHTQGRHPDERPTSYELSVPDDTIHGELGHIGYRCYICAQLSSVMIQAASSGGEYWQNKQLLWQEECDKLQNQFDADVAAHFPDHYPIGCKTCPTTFEMPPKPLPPSERAIAQNARD